jgi:hypothetical protein
MTPDLKLIKEEMNILGYSIPEGMGLRSDEVEWFRTNLILRKEAEIERCGAEFLKKHKDFEIMRNCLRFGHDYMKLIEVDWINRIVDTVLNPAAVLQDMFGMVTRPTDSSKMTSYKFHRDQPWFKDTRTSFFIFLPLVDFTLENGCTEVVPGTHLFKRIPSDAFLAKHRVPLQVKAGQAVVMDAALWHKAGANKSSELRPLLFLKYQLAFMKQPINLFRSLGSQALQNNMSELFFQRIGGNCQEMGSHEDYRKDYRGWKGGQYNIDNIGLHDQYNVHEYL